MGLLLFPLMLAVDFLLEDIHLGWWAIQELQNLQINSRQHTLTQ